MSGSVPCVPRLSTLGTNWFSSLAAPGIPILEISSVSVLPFLSDALHNRATAHLGGCHAVRPERYFQFDCDCPCCCTVCSHQTTSYHIALHHIAFPACGRRHSGPQRRRTPGLGPPHPLTHPAQVGWGRARLPTPQMPSRGASRRLLRHRQGACQRGPEGGWAPPLPSTTTAPTIHAQHTRTNARTRAQLATRTVSEAREYCPPPPPQACRTRFVR